MEVILILIITIPQCPKGKQWSLLLVDSYSVSGVVKYYLKENCDNLKMHVITPKVTTKTTTNRQHNVYFRSQERKQNEIMKNISKVGGVIRRKGQRTDGTRRQQRAR